MTRRESNPSVKVGAHEAVDPYEEARSKGVGANDVHICTCRDAFFIEHMYMHEG